MLWFHLDEVSRISKFVETESRGYQGTDRNGGVIVYRIEFIWDDDEVLGTDGGGSCLMIWMNFMPLNHTLKNGIYFHN